MDPAVAIGLVVVIAAFLGWWLWAARRRGRTGGVTAEPRDAWDALNRGIDPSESAADEPESDAVTRSTPEEAPAPREPDAESDSGSR